MSLKIAIGLCNTGVDYIDTRHNAGFIALNEIALSCGASFVYSKYCSAYIAKLKVGVNPLLLAYADGYMNLSGSGIVKILKYHNLNISETAVLYDDINLDVGRMKLSLGGSAGGHNGVADIMQKCGNSFMRIRLGIGAKPDKRMDLADYVLGKFSESDLTAIKSLDVKGVLALSVSRGFESAQNVYNRRDS